MENFTDVTVTNSDDFLNEDNLSALDIICKGSPALLQATIDTALADEAVLKVIGSTANLKKIIYIEGKLINFVI